MARKKKYRLFALRPDESGVKCATESEFSRITPKYVLIYKSGRKPENSVNIKSADLDRLTLADEQWLFESNLKIIAKEARKKRPETEAKLNAMVESLQKALEEERKKEEGAI